MDPCRNGGARGRMELAEKHVELENRIPDLIACPFCGSLGVAIVGFAARCGTCGAVGPFGPTDVEAARRWNERANDPKSRGGRRRWAPPKESE